MANAIVLVAVLKSEADLKYLLTDHWYRIPVAFAPKQTYSHVAFYQPASFGKTGKQIRYYAKVLTREIVKRRDLLPDELDHPRSDTLYHKLVFRNIHTLKVPIKNIVPRRVTFGLVPLTRFFRAHDLLELYGIPPTEQIVRAALGEFGVPVLPEVPIRYSTGRWRIDLVVQCRLGDLAIECDNTKAHRSKVQQAKDQRKDLNLRYHGWRVIRVTDQDVFDHPKETLARLRAAIASLGGLSSGITDNASPGG